MRVGHDELVLQGEADDVPRARRYAAAALQGGPGEVLLGDVELVVSELVTNALLHAGAPASLRVLLPSPRAGDDVSVRVEVRDPTRMAPIRPVSSTEAMTGRGIALVQALASSWGVEQDGTGKVVWTVLSTSHVEGSSLDLGSPDFDIDTLLAAWDDEPAEARQVTVRLGDVPTDLLLAAKAHVDNLVREFTLAAAGAESGNSAAVPSHLAELVETVVHRFAEPRRAIKRQAVKAAAAGEARTDLVLTLTPASVAAGLAYLEALEAADAYARAARLLTLETPARLKVFRRWYVEALVSQVSGAAGTDTPSPSFEERLLHEVDRLTATQRANERSARLQEVTAALGATTTAEEVADVVVIEGVAALGASGGSVLIPSEHGRLSLRGSYGYSEALMAHLSDQVAEGGPSSGPWRSEPVWLESRQERDALFPELATLEPQTSALCIVPVRLADRVLGALRFSFEQPRLFDDAERKFTLSLAAQTAQALDRSALLVAERGARAGAEALAERLARLQRVTAELTASTDIDEVGEIIVSHTTEALGATLGTLSLLQSDGNLALVRHRGSLLLHDADRWRAYPVDATLPAGEAMLTQTAVVVIGQGELARRYPSLGADPTASAGLVCVPMRHGNQAIGVLTLSFADDPSALGEPSLLAFLQTLGDVCAQVIERHRALAAVQDANDKLAFLADASAAISASLDYRTTLTKIARLVVPRVADLCAIHLIDDDGAMNTVAVAHIDSDRLQALQRRQQEFPVDLNEQSGVAQVIRTGVSELFSRSSDADLVAGAPDARGLAADRALGLSSVLVVPMLGRTGVIGAIALVHADSGRSHDLADQAMAEDLGRRAAVAVENAAEFRQQGGRLAAISRVADAAQQAILAPVPSRIGPLLLSAAYVSAAREALIGGDLYEFVRRPDSLRVLIGDVRGKGLDAVRLATVVLGEFRASAADEPDLVQVAVRVDRRLGSYLGDEDFVTALMVDLRDDGRCEIVCCGHPPAILCRDGRLTSIDCLATVPLGLGAQPVPVTLQLSPGDRLLLFTDGLVEARSASGQFVELATITAPLADERLDTVLSRVLAALHRQVGPELGDDLALVAVEYQP